jgi:(S)-3,5-dihydroxyphenylglycine transaminase
LDSGAWKHRSEKEPEPMNTHLAHDLEAWALHASLTDSALESMNFLNEVGSHYPDAVSFASGRPTEEFFDVELIHRYVDRYCRTLFQYGRTKGIVHELIARQLAADEGILVDPESVVVTVGCQEAMFLVIRALRRDERDVLLAVSPVYVGLTGAARLADMPVRSVRGGAHGVDLADLVGQARAARDAGLRPRACYVMPDFANPSGVSMPVALRRELLEVAEREGILLMEDNPYGLFHDETAQPTLKSLDTSRQVVYLGSFAKTGFPGARVGYAVADQRVVEPDGRMVLLADHLSKIKSMLTVNTSPIAQAVVGGRLLSHDGSLVQANQWETAVYRRNRRLLLAGLAARFRSGEVTWNSPSGGFFVVVTLPFPVDDDLLEYSAREYGVLWTPMSHFYDGTGGEHQVRLACSQLTPGQIETGLDRFAALVSDVRASVTGSA